jgi:hypothetical protein
MPIPEEVEVRRLATIKESAEARQCAIWEEQQSLQFYPGPLILHHIC